MIIKEFYIKEGLFDRTFEFDNYNNLIFSKSNSNGKTTLLRSILYGMGYKIPPTKNFKFSKCNTKLILDETYNGEIQLIRNGENSIELRYKNSKEIYVLPEQHTDVLKVIYGSHNDELINNILGSHYIDQEKGWTLLNRGVVIGSNHFNIEELVRGLGDKDCSDLLSTQKTLKSKIEKYNHIKDIVDYKKSVKNQDTSLIPEEKNKYITDEINKLIVRKNIICNRISSIEKTLKDNKRFEKFVSEMCILVRDDNGNEIRVSSDNIVGLSDSIDILISKRKMYEIDLINITKELERLENARKKEDSQLSFFESIDSISVFDMTISRIPINETAVDNKLNDLQKELKKINKSLEEMSIINNQSVNRIIKSINKYAIKLEIENSDNFGEKYLFTSNLKELSGAVLHKTVFAFKLAYILEIQNKINLKLPIILDSPSGKEIDRDNIQKMMNILNSDFKENQIIIASIYNYDLPNLNQIELDGRMI